MRLTRGHLTGSLLGQRFHGEVARDPVLGGEGDFKGRGGGGEKDNLMQKPERKAEPREEARRKADSPRKWTEGT